MVKPRQQITDTLRFAFQVLNLIPHRTHKTAKQIHNELKAEGTTRDLRSVQRMLRSLVEAYPQIEVYEKQRPFGYKWGTQAPKIMLPSMSTTEALLLAMAKNYLTNVLPQELNKTLQSYFMEAYAVLNSPSSDRSAKDWLQKVRVIPPTQPLIPPKVQPEVFEIITHCLFNNLEISFKYRNRQSVVRDYLAHPLGLIDRDPFQYLVADSLREPEDEMIVRTFAMHRILRARQHIFSFDPPADFDLSQYVHEGRHMYGQGETIKLTFEIRNSPGAHLREAFLASDQTIQELPDGWLRISATINESLELKRWLNGYAEDVRNISMKTLNVAINPTERS